MQHGDGLQDLIDYFAERPVVIDSDYLWDAWHGFVHHYLHDENKAQLTKFLGKSIEEIDPSDYEVLTPQAKRVFADYLEQYGHVAQMKHDDPRECESWMWMEPVGAPLPPSTWLVHFTDHADAILTEGFRFGESDINRLAFTIEANVFATEFTRREHAGPGYNFAYPCDGSVDLDIRQGPSVHGLHYGRDAVLFQAPGLKVHHEGDREVQVIFYGPDANRASMRLLRRGERGWTCDNSRPMKFSNLVSRLTK